MKKIPPTTYKIGSLREFAEWTKRVVRNPAAAADAPKKWFESEAIAHARQDNMGEPADEI